jgi:hypothetical protein
MVLLTVLLNWPSLPYIYAEGLYCIVFADKLYAMLFAFSLRLIGWFGDCHVFCIIVLICTCNLYVTSSAFCLLNEGRDDVRDSKV